MEDDEGELRMQSDLARHRLAARLLDVRTAMATPIDFDDLERRGRA